MKQKNSEFSKIIEINEISKKRPMVKTLVAEASENISIAKRLNVNEVKGFSANVKVSLKGAGVILVEANFKAEITQQCAISLKPVKNQIETSFEAFFTEEKYELPVCENMASIIPENDEEAPEYIDNGQIDLGDLLVQHLSLEIDLFPKAEGADFSEVLENNGIKNENNNPFSVLASLSKDES